MIETRQNLPVDAEKEPEDSKSEKDENAKDEKKKKEDEKKKDLPAFREVVKKCKKLEGFFSFYVNDEEGKVLMEILPDQFDNIFLCSLTREAGDGYYFDSGSMMGHFPFLLKRVGRTVQFIHKNVKFRADDQTPIQKAVRRGVSDSIMGSTKVESRPHSKTRGILINVKSLFAQDIDMVASSLKDWAKADYAFDGDNSYIDSVKPYAQNVELEVVIHFKGKKPSSVYTVADARSFMHRYHYSISAIPETNYRSRFGDDRLGHFLTMHQDYTSQTTETPYVRYINRWHLEKSDPEAEVSPPKKPIVFWMENTVPVEYRESVKAGILLWNTAYERAGFKDAIVVKQQPDDADWEAGDVRYSTVRWIVHPASAYAVGPSRANPYTGELYHADVRIGSDFVRSVFGKLEQFVDPVSMNLEHPDFVPGVPGIRSMEDVLSNHQMGLALHAAFGWSLLSAREVITPDDPRAKEYLHNFLVHLVAHEVGHTLGLRHNFKGSTLHPAEKLHEEELTTEQGLTNSIMDYVPVNIAPEDFEQGQYWQTTLGPYDYWVIEYAHKTIDADSPEGELPELEKIASKVASPELAYGTDEDAGSRGIDPACNRWDLGADMLEYHKKQIALAKELWGNMETHFSKPGTRYQKLRRVFGYGLSQYQIAAMQIPKYIGGIYHYRDHMGDPDGRLPFEPVSAARQREALEVIWEEFFSPDAFRFSGELLNKLATDRFPDFRGSSWRDRFDYPLHDTVISIQRMLLDHLYDPSLLARMLDIELRYDSSEDPFTIAEMFQKLREAIWSELVESTNINSFRRALQREHLGKMLNMLLRPDRRTPQDASSLARMDLIAIRDDIAKALSNGDLDVYSRAHLDETQSRVELALKPVVEKHLIG